uniref:Serpin domain-containing protein n=1 Tax=Timema shepardi TaxID=629360 RepID=A0A7R9B193_TIMSH|nr:unnamed protein product [Timema shepardi]
MSHQGKPPGECCDITRNDYVTQLGVKGPAVPSEEILGVALLVSDGEVGFRNSNSLVYCESSASDHVAIEAGVFPIFVMSESSLEYRRDAPASRSQVQLLLSLTLSTVATTSISTIEPALLASRPQVQLLLILTLSTVATTSISTIEPALLASRPQVQLLLSLTLSTVATTSISTIEPALLASRPQVQLLLILTLSTVSTTSISTIEPALLASRPQVQLLLILTLSTVSTTSISTIEPALLASRPQVQLLLILTLSTVATTSISTIEPALLASRPQTVAYGIGGKAVTHTALEGGNFRLRSGKLRLMTGGFDSLTTTILGGSHYLRQQTVALQLTVTENGYFDNLVLSGVSLETVLALCSMGAVKTTKKQMQSALRLSRNQCATKLCFKTLIEQLNSESHVTLNVVGAVYADKSMSIKTKFTSVAQKYFNSMVVREDFQNNTSVAIGNINSWVASLTENTITELVGPDSVTPSTKLLLVNAIYFKGSWAAPFNKFQTEPSSFYIDSNNSITVSMMHKKGKFLYYDNQQLNSQILAMDYQGKTMRLLIILPKKRDGLADLEKCLNCLNDLHLYSLNNTYVNASIPKFEISYSKDFSSTLQKMMSLRGTPADVKQTSGLDIDRLIIYAPPCTSVTFIRVIHFIWYNVIGLTEHTTTPDSSMSVITHCQQMISTRPSQILPWRFLDSSSVDYFLQKAYLKVDEAGTEAAAVSGRTPMIIYHTLEWGEGGHMKQRRDSAVMMLRSSLNLTPDKMVQFNMDHPFLFLLQHISTKTIIFHGRVIRPSLA